MWTGSDTKLKFPVIPQQHFRPSASGWSCRSWRRGCRGSLRRRACRGNIRRWDRNHRRAGREIRVVISRDEDCIQEWEFDYRLYTTCFRVTYAWITWYECQKVFWHSFDTRIATLLRSFRNPPNIRNPLIYCVNRYFLIFGVSQVQKPYRASTNSFLTFWHWYHRN